MNKPNELRTAEKLLKRLEGFHHMTDRERMTFVHRHLPELVHTYRWMLDELMEDLEWTDRTILLVHRVYSTILSNDRRKQKLGIRMLMYLIGKPEVRKELLVLLSHLRTKRMRYEKRPWFHPN